MVLEGLMWWWVVGWEFYTCRYDDFGVWRVGIWRGVRVYGESLSQGWIGNAFAVCGFFEFWIWFYNFVFMLFIVFCVDFFGFFIGQFLILRDVLRFFFLGVGIGREVFSGCRRCLVQRFGVVFFQLVWSFIFLSVRFLGFFCFLQMGCFQVIVSWFSRWGWGFWGRVRVLGRFFFIRVVFCVESCLGEERVVFRGQERGWWIVGTRFFFEEFLIFEVIWGYGK